MKSLNRINITLKFNRTDVNTTSYSNNKELRKIVKEYFFREYDRRKHYELSNLYIETDNVIYDYIASQYKQYLPKDSRYEVVLTDYSEETGSLLIKFSLVVIGVLSDYEKLSSGIERFLDDLRSVFNSNTDHFMMRAYYDEEYGNVQMSNTAQQSWLGRNGNSVRSWTVGVALILSVLGIFDDQVFHDRNEKVLLDGVAHTEQAYGRDLELYVEHQTKEEMIKVYAKNVHLALKEKLLRAELERDTPKIELILELQSQIGWYPVSE